MEICPALDYIEVEPVSSFAGPWRLIKSRTATITTTMITTTTAAIMYPVLDELGFAVLVGVGDAAGEVNAIEI